MKAWALAIAMSALAPAASAQDADLSGVWQGQYWGGGNQPTHFVATLEDPAGPRFSGSIVEQNNFGAQGSPFLLATLHGSTSGEEVSFIKSYDGTADQSHSVNYSGRLISERRIVGTWSIGTLNGQFEMAR